MPIKGVLLVLIITALIHRTSMPIKRGCVPTGFRNFEPLMSYRDAESTGLLGLYVLYSPKKSRKLDRCEKLWRTRNLILMFLLIAGIEPHPGANPMEAQLIEKLFKNYTSNARPVKKLKNSVDMKFDIAINQLLDVDEKNQIITVNTWVRMYWTDEYLTWNKSKYDGLSAIRVDGKMIWKPDIRLYNTAQKGFKGMDIETETKPTIYSDGFVAWLSPFILQSSCKMDVTYFPFDDQHCPMEFGSWSYDGAVLNITQRRPTADITPFKPSGEFQLIDAKVLRKVTYYKCCPEPYPTLIYTIHFRRRGRFYLMNTILPSVMIAFLSFLSFFLPAGSGERTGLVITTLLSLAVFMMIVSENVPPTSEVFPLLGQLLTAIMGEIGVALIMNCLIISWADKDIPPPKFIKYIFKLSCKNSGNKISTKSQITNGKPVLYPEMNGHMKTPDPSQDILVEEFDTPYHARTETNKNENNLLRGKPADQSVIKHLSIISSAVKNNQEEGDIKQQWKRVTEIIDRICIFLFSLTVIITLAACLSLAPNLTM